MNATRDPERPTILVVEDDLGLTQLVSRVLRREGFSVLSTPCGADALAALADVEHPLLLLDYRLPDMSADELVDQLNGASTPFVVMTGNGDERTAVRMMKRGARDYLVKDDSFLEMVPHTMHRVTREIAQERRLEQADRELRLRDREQQRIIELLRLVNTARTKDEFVGTLLNKIRAWTGCDAVGLRLVEGRDFPYYESVGFSDDFTLAENSLCVRDAEGAALLDSEGVPTLTCMCGAVIRGECDANQPFFTEHGSFFTPCTSELLATTSESERGPTRNRCNGDGYETVALFPLRSGPLSLGLLQINARQAHQLQPRDIEFYERVADQVSIALAQFQAQERLRLSEERYRSYIDNAPDGISVTDGRGRYIEANPAMCDLLGLAREDVLGLSHLDQLHGTERIEVKQAVTQLVESGTATWQYQGLNGRGREYWATVSVVKLDDDRYLGFVKDITPRKQAEAQREQLEAQLRHQQKLESLGTLAGGVAHEINNPIHIVMNCVELALDDAPPDSELTENLRDIAEASERVATIVRNLLAFARSDAEAHGPARMGDLVERTVSLIRKVFEKDQIELEVDLAPDLPLVRCRSDQIQQVLMNLMTNARDALNARYPAADADKCIRLTAHTLETGPELWLRTTIEDRGVGVPTELRERIFDPFFTTKPRDKGTGLGLSVSHGIVTEHGGRLSVDSEPGAFARFHVDLLVDDSWPDEADAFFTDESTLY